MSSAANLTLLRYSPESRTFADVVALYARVWPREDAAAHEAIMRRHATYPDYKGLLAVAASGALAGFVYGATALPEQWWTQRIAAVLGPECTARDLVGSFAVTELAVAPEWRQQGVGERLMRSLLSGLPHDRATLSTEVHNTAARHLYERLGLTYLVERMEFTPGDVSYVVMHRRLPLA